MNILAFESSCDETAVAVVRDGRTVLSDAIASQADIHALFPVSTAVKGHIKMNDADVFFLHDLLRKITGTVAYNTELGPHTWHLLRFFIVYHVFSKLKISEARSFVRLAKFSCAGARWPLTFAANWNKIEAEFIRA